MNTFDNYFTTFEQIETPPVLGASYIETKQKYDFLEGKTDELSAEPIYNFWQLPITTYSDFSSEHTSSNFETSVVTLNQELTQDTTISDNYSNIALSIISLARSFKDGGRYILGALNPETKTFDCSGLMNYIFKQHGIKIPRTTRLLNKDGHRISKSEVRPGDLALFIKKGSDHGHVGLVAEVNGDTFTMIDARGRKFGIVERPVKMSTPTAFLRYIPTNKNTQNSFLQILNAASTPSAHTTFRNHSDYIKTMYGIFYNELQKLGIDASLYAPALVAQTAFESGWGTSNIAKNANNFGGIRGKKGTGYTTKNNGTFRSYASVLDFAHDYVSLLKNRFKAFDVPVGLFVKQIRDHKYFHDNYETYQTSFNKILQTVLKTL